MPPLPPSTLQSHLLGRSPRFWRRPAFAWAVLAALLLHGGALLPLKFWRPWQAPAERPRLWAQVLPAASVAKPPEPATEATADTSSAAEAPDPADNTAADSPPEHTPPLLRTEAKQAPPAAPPTSAPSPQTTPTVQVAAQAAAPSPSGETAQDPSASLSEMAPPESVLLRFRTQLSLGGERRNQGEAELRWKNMGDSRYELLWQQNWDDGKHKTQRSQGRLGPSGLQPERYSERSDSSSERATHFVYDKQSLIYSNNRPPAPLLLGMQDRLSVYLQLGGLLAAQVESQALGEFIDVPVTTLSESHIWRWQVLGYEKTQGSQGPENALKLQYRPSQTWEPSVTVWFSSSDFLPLRILSLYPTGQQQEAQLTSIGSLAE